MIYKTSRAVELKGEYMTHSGGNQAFYTPCRLIKRRSVRAAYRRFCIQYGFEEDLHKTALPHMTDALINAAVSGPRAYWQLIPSGQNTDPHLRSKYVEQASKEWERRVPRAKELYLQTFHHWWGYSRMTAESLREARSYFEHWAPLIERRAPKLALTLP